LLLQDALGLPPFDELTDLAPNAAHHLHDMIIGSVGLATKKLHDSEELAAVTNRKTDRSMQSNAGGDTRAREVGIRHVGHGDGPSPDYMTVHLIARAAEEKP
jgi:hypothetical protein